jgi:predicted enzyme related to lactoylglutathione lyase
MPISTEDQTRAVKLRELCPLLFVQDIQRSITFYSQTLGFNLTRQADSGGSVFWCMLERDVCALMLQQSQRTVHP